MQQLRWKYKLQQLRVSLNPSSLCLLASCIVMGKSSKKSAPEVTAAPAATMALKPSKKGKRHAEEEIEKSHSSKKHKSTELQGVVSKKEKTEVKSKMKKVEPEVLSASVSKKDAKVSKKVKAEPLRSDSSSDESSEEELAIDLTSSQKKKALANNGSIDLSAKKRKDQTETAGLQTPKPSKGLSPDTLSTKDKAVVENKKTAKDVSTVESSDDSSSSDEETATKTSKKDVSKTPEKQENLHGTKNVKKESSTSESSGDDSDDNSDEDEHKEPGALSKKSSNGATNMESSGSSDESDSDESTDSTDEDVAKVIGVKPDSKTEEKKAPTISAANPESDSSDSGSDSSDSSDSSDEKKDVPLRAGTTSDSSDSSDSSDEDEGNDVKMTEATPQRDSKLSAPKSEKKNGKPSSALSGTGGSTTVFIGNLPFEVENADIENFFSGVGDVVDVRLAMDGQRFRGFGHVEFATAEAAQEAIELNGEVMNGRKLRVDIARRREERPMNTPSRDSYSSGKPERKKVFVKGFDTSMGKDEIIGALGEHFNNCGEIVDIFVPTEYSSGAVKGIAYMQFANDDGFNKAFDLNGSQLGDNYLVVEEALPPRNQRGDDWSGGRGSGGRSGGRRGGGRDRDGGARFGGRGRGRGDRGRGGRGMGSAPSGKKTTFEHED